MTPGDTPDRPALYGVNSYLNLEIMPYYTRHVQRSGVYGVHVRGMQSEVCGCYINLNFYTHIKKYSTCLLPGIFILSE